MLLLLLLLLFFIFITQITFHGGQQSILLINPAELSKA